MKTLLRISAVVVFLPSVALASAPRTFGELANLGVSLLDGATGLLVLAGIVIYFYGLSTNILKMKDEGGDKMRAYFVWGMIVIFIMVSIWGILGLLQNTLFGNGNSYNGSSNAGTPAPSFNVPSFGE